MFSDSLAATTYISIPHASGGISIAINNASGHPTTPRRPVKQTPAQTPNSHCRPFSHSTSLAARVSTCDQQNSTYDGKVVF